MFCSQCGSEVSEKSKFCYKCGARIAEYQDDISGYEIVDENNNNNDVTNYHSERMYNNSNPIYGISETSDETDEMKTPQKDDEESYKTLFQEKQEENEYLRQQNYQLMKRNDGYRNMTNHKEKRKQSTVKMIFSIFALIFIICGLNMPFFGKKYDSYTFKEAENRTRLIKSTLSSVGYVNDFFGEETDNDEQKAYDKAKTVLIVIMVLKTIIAISIVLLIVNIFIPVKTGLLLLGLGGIIANVVFISLFEEMLKTMESEGAISIGGFLLMLGFALEILSDPGRQNINHRKEQRDFFRVNGGF